MIPRNSCYSWADFTQDNGRRRTRHGGNKGPHRIRRGGGRHGEGCECHARRQGIHRRRLRHRARARRRRRGEGRNGRRSRGGAPRRRARFGARDSAAARRRRKNTSTVVAMAVESAAPPTDKDLASIAEARALARAARQAQSQLAELSQEQIDAIVTAMAKAVTPQAETLARLAVEETGYGVVADKIEKNLFS